MPDGTTEVTQVRELLAGVQLAGSIVTVDAVHACTATAEYIAGPAAVGGRDADCLLAVKGNQAALQRVVFDAIQASGPRQPDHQELDDSHGRIMRRSTWVTSAPASLGFPHAAQVARIRRDRLDRDGQLLRQGSRPRDHQPRRHRGHPAQLAALARRHWHIESCHWLRSLGVA